MKWKNVLFTIVLNIFLMLVVTILIEYHGLSQRMQEARDNIQLAFDTAIESSTATEELFSYKGRNLLQSSYSDNGTANTLVWSPSATGGSWYSGNNYILSWYYWKYGRFPTESEYTTIYNSGRWTPYTTWCWLYGGSAASNMEDEWKNDAHVGLGQTYTNYPYTCRNLNTKRIYQTGVTGMTLGTSNSDRKPSIEFSSFFNNIGYKISGNYAFKEPDVATGRFTVIEREAPTLLKMGLYFNNYNIYTDSLGASYINDDMISTVKLGKRENGMSYSQSIYFYSPYSLGVTYVPTSVLKPMFLYNLDSIVRLGVASQTGFSSSSPSDTYVNFNQASGCISTNVYSRVDSGSNDTELHKENGADLVYTPGNGIINDGQVEYDLRSAKVRVDYFYINIHSNSFYNTASALYGALPARDSSGNIKTYTSANGSVITATGNDVMTNIGTLIKSNETGTSLKNNVDGGMIVAKCSIRMKIHITYESFIFQWLCYKDHSASDSNHYDIKLYNPSTGFVDTDSDGVWYEYSKYYAYTR